MEHCANFSQILILSVSFKVRYKTRKNILSRVPRDIDQQGVYFQIYLHKQIEKNI